MIINAVEFSTLSQETLADRFIVSSKKRFHRFNLRYSLLENKNIMLVSFSMFQL
jgi:hypothetical protein